MCQFLEASHKARTTYLGSSEPGFGQPGGLQDSSRWSQNHRNAIQLFVGTLKGCKTFRSRAAKRWHPFRVRTIKTLPEVFAPLRPPATFLQPSGLQARMLHLC